MSYKVLIPGGQTITTDTTIPAPTTETGTITAVTTSKTVAGDSTTFLTSKIQAMDWLYVATATAGLKLIGQVDSVESNTSLTLVDFPTEAVTAQAFKTVRPTYKKVQIFPSATTGVLFGKTVGTIQRIPLESEDGHIGPIEINGTTSSFFVLTEY